MSGSSPRQIVLIMTDTQSTGVVGCYNGGSERYALKTPNIDRLAAGGIRFDRAYCAQPVCGPARAALFTGTYPHSNGSWGNSMPLDAHARTIGQRLRDAGLHTAYIGKWHLDGGDYFGYGRCPDGWDPAYWYDMKNYLDELPPEERQRSRRFETCLEPGFPADFTFAHRCSRRAIDFLERCHDEEFFLVLSYDEPHGPSLCPAPYNTMYRDYRHPLSPSVHDTLADKPPHIRRWASANREQWERVQARGYVQNAHWYGCNSFVDAEIGRVLDAVERYAPGALVIYTADHGHAEFQHGITGKGPAMYEEITRIPFLVRWPGVAPAGATCAAPVSHVDVVPTLLETCGLARPEILEGRSLLGAIRTPAAAPAHPVFLEFNRFEIDHDGMLGFMPIRCVRDERFKLAVNLLSTDELYDLENDPHELRNLIDSPAHAAVRDRLHERLLDWMNDTRDPFRGYVWEQRPWRTDGLDKGGMTRQRPLDGFLPWQLDYDTGLPMAERARPKNFKV